MSQNSTGIVDGAFLLNAGSHFSASVCLALWEDDVCPADDKHNPSSLSCIALKSGSSNTLSEGPLLSSFAVQFFFFFCNIVAMSSFCDL